MFNCVAGHGTYVVGHYELRNTIINFCEGMKFIGQGYITSLVFQLEEFHGGAYTVYPNMGAEGGEDDGTSSCKINGRDFQEGAAGF